MQKKSIRNLSKYAVPFKSKGRFFKEKKTDLRNDFQRDRDRIIHSTAFRRLKHKTQVFVNTSGDHFRTRITHSLEVSQIARTLSKYFNLNEDLSETLSLAHDLGHTPFGHAGEEALNKSMSDYGGFDHNAQTLRIVTLLEKKYFSFDGLNLTWETLEGIVKHNGPLEENNIPFAIQDYLKNGMNLEIETWCGAEAQVAALSDDIAYFSHDFEDGVRAKFFTLEEIIDTFSILNDMKKSLNKRINDFSVTRIVNEIRRLIISKMIIDLVVKTKENIKKFQPKSSQDVRLLGQPLIEFSDAMIVSMQEIRFFLTTKMYKHYEINRMTSKARRIVSDLFKISIDDKFSLLEIVVGFSSVDASLTMTRENSASKSFTIVFISSINFEADFQSL